MEKNEKTDLQGFQVIKLHYSADPDKDEEWVKRVRRDTPTEDWEREFELKPVGHMGNYPVYGDYKRNRHEDETLAYNPLVNKVIYRGWDFGKVHPCVECLQIDGLKKNFIGEIYGTQIYLEQFVQLVMEYSAREFPGAQFVDWVDATGKNERDNGLPSVQILRRYGLKPYWRMQDVEEGVEYIKHELVRLVDGRPQLMVNPRKCPQLARAFRGGYQRNKKGIILKDGEFDHPADAARYVISGVVTGMKRRETDFYRKIKEYRYKPMNPYTGR